MKGLDQKYKIIKNHGSGKSIVNKGKPKRKYNKHCKIVCCKQCNL